MERLYIDMLAYTYISGNDNGSLFQVLNCNFDVILSTIVDVLLQFIIFDYSYSLACVFYAIAS